MFTSTHSTSIRRNEAIRHHQVMVEALERRELLSVGPFLGPEMSGGDWPAKLVTTEAAAAGVVASAAGPAEVAVSSDLVRAVDAVKAAPTAITWEGLEGVSQAGVVTGYDIPDTFAGAFVLYPDAGGGGHWVTIYVSPSYDKDMFKFVATATGKMTIDMRQHNSALDSFLDIYNGSRKRIASNDDGGYGANARATFNAVAGRTYYARARGYGTSQGEYELVMSTSRDYFVYNVYGGRFHDAEKSPSSSEDDNLCWAAAASNVLAWTGWGRVAGMTSSDQVFAYMQNHWTDEGGLPYYGFTWWMDGVDRSSPNGTGWSREDVQGGAFFPTFNLGDIHNYSTDSDVVSMASQYLYAGHGVTLGIYTDSGGGHAITLWGVRYDIANSNSIVGVWITDSDDNMGTRSPPNVMRYYGEEYVGGRSYLLSYGGGDAWYVGNTAALPLRSSAGYGLTGTEQAVLTASDALSAQGNVLVGSVSLLVAMDRPLVPEDKVAPSASVLSARRWDTMVDSAVRSLMANEEREENAGLVKPRVSRRLDESWLREPAISDELASQVALGRWAG